MQLNWPPEFPAKSYPEIWIENHSNICLDFHGDPSNCNCVVFSDGNHHMALQESLESFNQKQSNVNLFYATTPPNVLLNMIDKGELAIGNLILSIRPNIFIGPEPSLKSLLEKKVIKEYQKFMRSLGVALIVKKGNPKSIVDFTDLVRNDVILALSNKQSEKASYKVYQQSLFKLVEHRNLKLSDYENLLASNNVRHSRLIHHREIPRMVFTGEADVALVYYHLALRYARIFSEHLEMIPLGPPNDPGLRDVSVCTDYFSALVDDGGMYGAELLNYLHSDEVAAIYHKHGLCRP